MTNIIDVEVVNHTIELAVPGVQGPTGATGAMTVKEQDGTPSVSSVTEIRVPNGQLTDEGSGAVSIDAAPTTHTHAIGDISGLVPLAQGGLGEDASSYAGLVAINSGDAAARTITGTSNEIDVAAGDGSSGDPTIGIADNPTIPGTGAVLLPTGTTAQRPANTAGKLRWNTTDATLEVANGSGWTDVLVSGGSSIATGTYTGDAAATKAITGVGFQPKVLMIYTQLDGISIGIAIKTDQDGTSAGYGYLGTAWQYETDQIISLDADGFTVGDGTGGTGGNALNTSGRVYVFIAWK